MAVINQHWYSVNEGVAYPVDEAATGVDDAGARLPGSVVTDLNLRWPDSLGRHAFLASLSVTEAMVSLTVQACADLDGPAGFAPLAAVAVPRPVDQSRQYRLEPQAAGVGGWVVFGSGAGGGPYRGRFSTPRQSFLTARAARAYRALPVSGVRTLFADRALEGTVVLRATPPLRLSKETREVNGVLRDCVVLRLEEDGGAEGFPVPDAAADLTGYRELSAFRRFAGPCAGRPESRTCGEPEPIEFINSVGPDCEGRITVEFRGCARVSRILDGCGVAVDCGLGLAEACLPDRLPDSDGVLPGEYPPALIPPAGPEAPESESAGPSESLSFLADRPYQDCFEGGEAVDFVVKAGLWAVLALAGDALDCYYEGGGDAVAESPAAGGTGGLVESAHVYAANTAAGRNVSVWEGADGTTLRRRATAQARMMPGPVGARHNAAVVFNHRPHPTLAGRFVYHLAELDYDAQEVRIAYFDGSAFHTVAAADAPGIALNRWYEVSIRADPAGADTVDLTATFTSLTDSNLSETLSAVVAGFLPSTGRIGLGSNRAVSRFRLFRVEETD